jgi:hypothetical protein
LPQTALPKNSRWLFSGNDVWATRTNASYALTQNASTEANHAGALICAPETRNTRKVPAAKALYAIPDRTRTSACDSSLIAGDIRANIYGSAIRLESDVRRPQSRELVI